MNNKKAYVVKGSSIEGEIRKEWIEVISASKKRAEKIKSDLNKSLLKDIEKGKEVFDLYLKESDDPNPSWCDLEFDIEKMNDKEFTHFTYYRYGTKLPFRIDEIDLV